MKEKQEQGSRVKLPEGGIPTVCLGNYQSLSLPPIQVTYSMSSGSPEHCMTDSVPFFYHDTVFMSLFPPLFQQETTQTTMKQHTTCTVQL